MRPGAGNSAMRISELRAKLEELESLHGDLLVLMDEDTQYEPAPWYADTEGYSGRDSAAFGPEGHGFYLV